MKQNIILLAAFTSIAIVSCAKIETLNAPTKEIKFNVYTTAPSKAVEITTGTLNSFLITSYYSKSPLISSSTIYPMLESKEIIYTTEGWLPSEDARYYWPVDENNKIHFFAWSILTVSDYKPLTVAGGTISYPQFTYSVPTAADNQKDFIAASALDQTHESDPHGTGAVVFNFKHLLTQINFSIRGEAPGYNYRVNSIQINDLCTTGVFTFDGPSSTSIGSWGFQTTKGNFSYVLPTAEVDRTCVGNTPISLKTADNAMMVLPQDFIASDAKIVVSYDILDSGGNIIHSDNKDIILSSSITFSLGQKILFEIMLPLGMNPMTFSYSVEAWDSEEYSDIYSDKFI